MKRLINSLAFVLAFVTLNAQHQMPPFEGEILGTATTTKIQAKYLGVVNPSIDADGVNWMKSIKKVTVPAPKSTSPSAEHKAEMMKLKLSTPVETNGENGSSRLMNPVQGQNFGAHNVINSTPPDNTMAISNGGKILTSDNSTIEFYNESGSALNGTLITHEEWFDDVAASLNITSGLFDPRALYDPVADRFIFVILHGYSPSTSKLMVCFSQTNDPSGNWNVYELSGNPFNDNSWTDYPHIGISENDLYITGNVFYNGTGFNQVVVFQMDKSSAYSGQTNVPTNVFNNIPGGSIGAFSLVPVSYGQQGEYGPGIYLISSSVGFNSTNRINLYQITAAATSNPSLNLISNLSVPSYVAPADAVQKGSTQNLNTNDCRMQNAFYLDDMIHAVHHANYQAGYAGVIYYRIPVGTPSNYETIRYGEMGKDYAFPAIASFGADEEDKSVMISFLSVSSSDYPEIRVVNCDDNMNFSNSISLRIGQSYINTWINPPSAERWGDYSQMQRKFNETEPTVWATGCYGAFNNRWKSWLSEVTGQFIPDPTPIVDFGVDTTAGYAPVYLGFYDSTLNDPTSWLWRFEGGNPSFSTIQNPFVGYSDTGWFEVKLTATNQFGSDSLVREGYIHVLSSDTVTEEPEGLADRGSEQMDMNVYPNPVADYELIHIDIENPTATDVHIALIDMQGRTVKLMYDDKMRAGMHRLTFNKLALSPGQYFLEVKRNGSITQHEKIIVQ